MTKAELIDALKDYPDGMPVFLYDEHECVPLISIKENEVEVYEHGYDEFTNGSEEIIVLKVIVLGVS